MLTPLLLAATLGGAPSLPNETWIQDEHGAPVRVVWGPANLPNLSDYRQPFEALDINGDGLVRPSELPKGHALETEWRLVDRNRDGVITAREWELFR